MGWRIFLSAEHLLFCSFHVTLRVAVKLLCCFKQAVPSGSLLCFCSFCSSMRNCFVRCAIDEWTIFIRSLTLHGCYRFVLESILHGPKDFHLDTAFWLIGVVAEWLIRV